LTINDLHAPETQKSKLGAPLTQEALGIHAFRRLLFLDNLLREQKIVSWFGMCNLESTYLSLIEMIRSQNGVEISICLGFCDHHMIDFTFIDEEMRE
jgi:hypothetical protein